MRRTLSLILVAAVIAILAFVPTPSHRTQAWDVWVVSESDHHPASGFEVTERYELNAPQTLTSDALGHVRFESRVPWSSFAQRLIASRSTNMHRLSLGPGGLLSMHAVGHGMMADETTRWTGSAPAMGMRITMHPVYKPIGSAGQHATSN
jgi:hypothetical protein